MSEYWWRYWQATRSSPIHADEPDIAQKQNAAVFTLIDLLLYYYPGSIHSGEEDAVSSWFICTDSLHGLPFISIFGIFRLASDYLSLQGSSAVAERYGKLMCDFYIHWLSRLWDGSITCTAGAIILKSKEMTYKKKTYHKNKCLNIGLKDRSVSLPLSNRWLDLPARPWLVVSALTGSIQGGFPYNPQRRRQQQPVVQRHLPPLSTATFFYHYFVDLFISWVGCQFCFGTLFLLFFFS